MSVSLDALFSHERCVCTLSLCLQISAENRIERLFKVSETSCFLRDFLFGLRLPLLVFPCIIWYENTVLNRILSDTDWSRPTHRNVVNKHEGDVFDGKEVRFCYIISLICRSRTCMIFLNIIKCFIRKMNKCFDCKETRKDNCLEGTYHTFLFHHSMFYFKYPTCFCNYAQIIVTWFLTITHYVCIKRSERKIIIGWFSSKLVVCRRREHLN